MGRGGQASEPSPGQQGAAPASPVPPHPAAPRQARAARLSARELPPAAPAPTRACARGRLPHVYHSFVSLRHVIRTHAQRRASKRSLAVAEGVGGGGGGAACLKSCSAPGAGVRRPARPRGVGAQALPHSTCPSPAAAPHCQSAALNRVLIIKMRQRAACRMHQGMAGGRPAGGRRVQRDLSQGERGTYELRRQGCPGIKSPAPAPHVTSPCIVSGAARGLASCSPALERALAASRPHLPLDHVCMRVPGPRKPIR